MKAIITNDDGGDASDLGLRLLPEGANDRALMRLLEQRYPMIRRLTVPGGEHALDVPIASPEMLDLGGSTELVLCTGIEIVPGVRMTVKSDPWPFSTLRDSVLRLGSGRWRVVELAINGRPHPHDLPCDVYPGAIVALTIEMLHEDGERGALALSASMVGLAAHPTAAPAAMGGQSRGPFSR